MIPRLIKLGLLLFLLFMASGAYTFFSIYPVIRLGILLSGFALFAAYLVFNFQALANIGSVLPYLCWILFYLLWGALASPAPQYVMEEVQTLLLRNIVFLAIIAMVIANRHDVRTAANLFQVVAIINCLVSLMSVINPITAAWLAEIYASTNNTLNELRPAGLWRQPNTAATVWVFTFILSHWAKQPFSMLGKIAAIIGVFLTASRGGTIVLLLFVVGYTIIHFKMAHIKVRHLFLSSIMLSGLLVFSTSDWAAANVAAFDSTNSLGLQQRFQRLVNLSETETTEVNTRRDLATETFNSAMQSPWYGYGLFLFHGGDYYPVEIGMFDVGSHNAYITVLGETGIFGLFVYAITVFIGLRSVWKSNTTNLDKAVLYMMWMCYLIFGIFRHTQFTLLEAMVFAGFLYHLPNALSKSAMTANGGYQDFMQSRFRRSRQANSSKAS